MNKKAPRYKQSTHEYVLWAIRCLLIGSIIINLVYIILALLDKSLGTKSDMMNAMEKNITIIFWALVTYALTFLHDYFEKIKKIHIPDILESIIIIFIYAGIFLSARFNLYDDVFWWDVVLHTASGVILGFIGFLAIYKINSRHSMNISPLLVAVFAFTFAVTMDVMFEIYEFAMDVIFGTDMQSWNLPATTIELGRSFQGIGLRDTMSDLIFDTIGALSIAVICFFLYKNEKKKTLKLMHEVFPDK
ncbi:MAG: hypothetical protein CVU55_07430 [Deltaproteobacteria bacterium HGW-Deltaproteobacteria-13]|jgi:hypothetical protein|nr:MAG: hypothetical protein CVU55_07430 [Deltaproteobacteria bacterium HGW-Deltaproteobacteria-13]